VVHTKHDRKEKEVKKTFSHKRGYNNKRSAKTVFTVQSKEVFTSTGFTQSKVTQKTLTPLVFLKGINSSTLSYLCFFSL
jgi:hypothetical protein